MTPKIFTFYLNVFCLILVFSACQTTKPLVPKTPITGPEISPLKLSGGSSGMEQIDEQAYLVVYDVKIHKDGVRMGLIKITNESIEVAPIVIDEWEEAGRASDLESICKIPNRENEYLVAESGNWKGKLGRIFHVKVDTLKLKATVLGSMKLPFMGINNEETVGDQYEAMTCLPYTDNKVMVLLGERGGSAAFPNGIIRWGIMDLVSHTLNFSESGLKGLTVKAPGNWTNPNVNRDMSDFYIDAEGHIWTVASEDQGDTGPFYSVIYKLGELDSNNPDKPVKVYNEVEVWKEIFGFKIEALSGPSKNIDCTLSFGTEDEIFGGVWRAIKF